MARQEFRGRSAAEAAIKACEALGVSRSSLKYDVVSESGEGLNRVVVIAVDAAERPARQERSREDRPREDRPREERSRDDRPREDRPREERSRDDRPREDRPREARSDGRSAGASEPRPRRDDGEGPSQGEGQEAGGEARQARDDRGGRGGDRDRGGRGGRGRRGGRGGRGGDRDRDRGGRGGGRDRDMRGGRGRGGRPQGADDDGIESLLNMEAVATTDVPERPSVTTELSPRAVKAKTVLEEMLRRMGVGLEVRVVQDQQDEIHFDIRGPEVERIIGKKGESLLSLQFLLNRIVARDEDGEQHVVLDAAGYRYRRRAALADLARRLATRALEERKVVRLSPMSAHDRRIFHITLQEMQGVSTRSQGDGLYRPLLIIPEASEAKEDAEA